MCTLSQNGYGAYNVRFGSMSGDTCQDWTCVSLTHVQSWQVAVDETINRGHFVAGLKFWVSFQCFSRRWIRQKAVNIVIQQPALILVHLGEEKEKFMVYIFPLNTVCH